MRARDAVTGGVSAPIDQYDAEDAIQARIAGTHPLGQPPFHPVRANKSSLFRDIEGSHARPEGLRVQTAGLSLQNALCTVDGLLP